VMEPSGGKAAGAVYSMSRRILVRIWSPSIFPPATKSAKGSR
jgi:hypothetical protein